MRLIDADALLKALNDYGLSYRADINGMIMQAPTIAPSGDLISRADAVKTFIKWGQKEFGYSDINREERFIDAINTLPSADNHGEWDSNQSCSICGCQPWYEHDIHTLNYCPNCGADMRSRYER